MEDWKTILTMIGSLGAAGISAFTLWKLQDKKRNDEADLVAFGKSLDRKLKEFDQTLIEKSSYLAEKGRSAATKEDVAEITRQVELVRVEVSAQSEEFKSGLSRRQNLHKLQVEKEFKVYESIWSRAVTLGFSIENLRPAMDFTNPNESPKDKWNNRYNDAREKIRDLHIEIRLARPFYPDNIFRQLDILVDECWQEIVDFEFSVDTTTWKMSHEGYKKARENTAIMFKRLDSICEIIRSRVFIE